jgi:hypothetical protein
MIHVLHVYIAVNDWWILMIQHWWLMIHEYWLMNIDQSLTISGWWFQTFFIFHNIWDNPAHSLIFFKMVKTTNQILIDDYWSILMSHLVTPSPWHDSSLGWFFEISRPGTLFTFRWTSIQHRYNDIYIYIPHFGCVFCRDPIWNPDPHMLPKKGTLNQWACGPRAD